MWGPCLRTMTATLSHPGHHRRRMTPFLASAGVAGLFAVGAIGGVALHQHSGDASLAVPDPPVASYPGSSVFDNQPTGGLRTSDHPRGFGDRVRTITVSGGRTQLGE